MPDAGHFAKINYEKQVHYETWSSINAPIIFHVVIDPILINDLRKSPIDFGDNLTSSSNFVKSCLLNRK